MTDPEAQIVSILRNDPLRWHILELVRSIELPDCWIGAGFVRNAIWDHLHDRAPSPLTGDVDVIWYDPDRTDPGLDRACEDALRTVEPAIAWSVKNQARMHVRNADPLYRSAIDAMRYWPETATAVAARRHGVGGCEVAAPLGFDDLFGLLLRPTSRFASEKRSIYNDRLRSKNWLAIWPMLREA